VKHFSQNTVQYYRDFGGFLEDLRSRYENRRVLSWYTRRKEEQSRTYGELLSDVACLRESLYARGLAGKQVAIAGENSYNWLVVWLACVSSGGAAVCIDPEQPDEALRHLIRQVKTEAVFASASCLSVFRDEAEQRFLLNGSSGDEAPSADSLILEGRELLDRQGGMGFLPAEQDPEAPAALVFTSGTTGESKPVILSQRALLNNACESNCYVSAGLKTFSSLPFCHAYGMTCAFLASLARGAELCFNGNLKTAIRDMRLSGAWSMLTVPLMIEAVHNRLWMEEEKAGRAETYRKLLKREAIRKKFGFKKPCRELGELRDRYFGTLRLIICGGAHMNGKIAEEFSLMGLEILEGYGITECGPLVSVNAPGWNRPGSVGRVLPGSRVRIENEEILVSGSMLMSGYYGMPGETDAVLKNGWFHTGDLGRLDKDGFLYITGRRKNLIVFKNGKKFSPEILEKRLRQIPLVKDVVVYGAESGSAADDVQLAASIYPDPAQAGVMSSYEILEELQKAVDQINDSLPFYQQIRMVNIREQEFDRTTLQKIKRHTV
jgi:long-chain acyl-CoA synthetase